MIYCVKHKPGDLVLPDGYKELKVGALFDQQGTDYIQKSGWTPLEMPVVKL